MEEKWYNNEKIREQEPFEQRNPLNLGPGVHDITFENEGRDVMTKWENRQTGEVKEINKRVFDVVYGDQKFAFFVTRGATTGSLFGQLVKVAKTLGGLTGKPLKIIVAGQQKQKRYQVQYGGVLNTPLTMPKKTRSVCPFPEKGTVLLCNDSDRCNEMYEKGMKEAPSFCTK